MQSMLIQFLPLMVIQSIYATIVFIMARKRRINPWFWTISSLFPGLDMLASGLFMLLTTLSMLDRLNALEMNKAFN